MRDGWQGDQERDSLETGSHRPWLPREAEPGTGRHVAPLLLPRRPARCGDRQWETGPRSAAAGVPEGAQLIPPSPLFPADAQGGSGGCKTFTTQLAHIARMDPSQESQGGMKKQQNEI